MKVAARLAAVAVAALTCPALANDSASELAAGGIVLVKTDAIAMQREDLVLSPAEVRVRYEMRNDTGQPVTLRVAFPLPELPSETPGGRVTTAGGHNIVMAQPTGPNFLGFRVWADGREIHPEVEIKAELPDGRNIADALQRIGGLKLVLRSGLFFPPDDPDLDTGRRRQLKELGAIEPLDDKQAYKLPWTARITFHWMQTFAPGVTVVEHSYKPIIGFRFIRQEPDGRVTGSGDGDPKRAFCIKGAAEEVLAAQRQKAGLDGGYLSGFTLGYVLQTARNWRGPIGTFHLTVQGGRVGLEGVSDPKQAKAVSFCADIPVQETGPMRFEASAKDYVPTQDLRVLFIAE